MVNADEHGEAITYARSVSFMRRLIPFLMLVVACGGTTEVSPDQPSSVGGTLNLRQGDYAIEFVEDSNQCVGSGRYGDVQEGSRVVVTDEHGDTLGEGQLGSGSRDVASFECVFILEGLEIVRAASEYTITVASQVGPTYTHDEIADLGWTIEVRLSP